MGVVLLLEHGCGAQRHDKLSQVMLCWYSLPLFSESLSYVRGGGPGGAPSVKRRANVPVFWCIYPRDGKKPIFWICIDRYRYDIEITRTDISIA
jgi:hypothetical protein